MSLDQCVVIKVDKNIFSKQGKKAAAWLEHIVCLCTAKRITTCSNKTKKIDPFNGKIQYANNKRNVPALHAPKEYPSALAKVN